MKKKLWITVAAVSAVLLAGSAVYAAGLGLVKDTQPEQKVDAAEQALLEAKEAKITETLGKLKVEANSEEAVILRDVLQHKEMTEQEISDYFSSPEELKNLTYEQAMAEYEKYAALTDMPWEEGKKTEGFSENLNKKFAYEKYANSIAVGEPLYQLKYSSLQQFFNGLSFEVQRDTQIWEEARKMHPEERYDEHYRGWAVKIDQDRKLVELSNQFITIFEQRKNEGMNLDDLTADMEALYQFFSREKRYYVNASSYPEIASDVHDYDYIAVRYLAGESIQQIVG